MRKSVSPEGPRPISFNIISRRHYKAEILPMRQKKQQPAKQSINLSKQRGVLHCAIV